MRLAHDQRHFTYIIKDPLSILRYPRQLGFVPDAALRRKIAIYFTNVFGLPYNIILPLLPETMPRWGKVRIAGGGDAIRCQIVQSMKRQERDSSYVRVRVSTFSRHISSLTSVLSTRS
jgi:hypothetical protein